MSWCYIGEPSMIWTHIFLISNMASPNINDSADNAASVLHVALQLLPFLPDDPEMWFLIVEAGFANANITTRMQFNQFVSHMSADVISTVKSHCHRPAGWNTLQGTEGSYSQPISHAHVDSRLQIHGQGADQWSRHPPLHPGNKQRTWSFSRPLEVCQILHALPEPFATSSFSMTRTTIFRSHISPTPSWQTQLLSLRPSPPTHPHSRSCCHPQRHLRTIHPIMTQPLQSMLSIRVDVNAVLIHQIELATTTPQHLVPTGCICFGTAARKCKGKCLFCPNVMPICQMWMQWSEGTNY